MPSKTTKHAPASKPKPSIKVDVPQDQPPEEPPAAPAVTRTNYFYSIFDKAGIDKHPANPEEEYIRAKQLLQHHPEFNAMIPYLQDYVGYH